MIYAYVDMNITNPESLGQYREASGEALQKHNGAVVSAGKDNVTIEGTHKAPDMAALLSFPDRAAAMAWINDPELASVHALRRGSGNVSIIVIG